jgi:hypothetical protein
MRFSTLVFFLIKTSVLGPWLRGYSFLHINSNLRSKSKFSICMRCHWHQMHGSRLCHWICMHNKRSNNFKSENHLQNGNAIKKIKMHGVSMTPHALHHLHHMHSAWRVNDSTCTIDDACIRNLSYLGAFEAEFKKTLSPWIRGPWGIVWWKKPKIKNIVIWSLLKRNICHPW